MAIDTIKELYRDFFSKDDVRKRFELLLNEFIYRSGTFSKSFASVSLADKKDFDKLVQLVNEIDKDIYENETDDETNRYILDLIKQIIFYMCLYKKISPPNRIEENFNDKICKIFSSDNPVVEIRHEREKLSVKLKNDIAETREFFSDICQKGYGNILLDRLEEEMASTVDGRKRVPDLSKKLQEIYFELDENRRSNLSGRTAFEILTYLNVLSYVYDFKTLSGTKDDEISTWVDKYQGYKKPVENIDSDPTQTNIGFKNLVKKTFDKVSEDAFRGSRLFYDIKISRISGKDDDPDPGFRVSVITTIPFSGNDSQIYKEIFKNKKRGRILTKFAFLPPEQNLYKLMKLASQKGIKVDLFDDAKRGTMVKADWEIVYPSVSKINIKEYENYVTYNEMIKAISNMYDNYTFKFEMANLLTTNESLWAEYLRDLYNKLVSKKTNNVKIVDKILSQAPEQSSEKQQLQGRRNKTRL